MRIFTLFLLSTSFAFFSRAQGLSGEIAFNSNFTHSVSRMAMVDNACFLAHYHRVIFAQAPVLRVSKYDASGNLIWGNITNPNQTYDFYVAAMEANGLGGVVMLGNGALICDVPENYRYYLRSIDTDGNVLWEIEEEAPGMFRAFDYTTTGLSVSNNGNVYVNFFKADSSLIKGYNNAGELIFNLQIDKMDLWQIGESSVFSVIASKGNLLIGFDANGETAEEIVLPDTVKRFLIHNGLIYVLTESSLHVFNQDFSEVSSHQFPGYFEFSNLKRIGNQFKFMSRQGSIHTVLTLNDNLELIGVQSVDAAAPSIVLADYSESHMMLANSVQLHQFNAARLRTFSLINPNDINVNRTDIGIVNIEFTQVIATPVSVGNVWNHKIYANVLVRNYGTNTLTSCRINHLIGQGIACEYLGYSQEFENLNIVPGDSAWVTLGLIHDYSQYFSGNPQNGQFTKNICVYTSYANKQTDLVVSNDAFCKQLVVGYVGIDEFQAIQNQRTLVKIVDLFGREIEEQNNQVMIFIYSDGTSEKVFRME